MTPSSPGLTLCRCGHEERLHRRAGAPNLCRGPDPDRRYGKPTCGCLRFTEAPFAAQQMSLLEDDAPLLASFNFREVKVVGRV